MDEMRLAGRVALVTGATGSLGGTVVRAFLSEGASVAGVGASPPTPAAAASGDERWLALSGDLRTIDGAEEVVRAAVARFQTVDILAHLVGGWIGGADVVDMTPSDWERALSLNLTTTFNICRAVIPQMRAQGFGRIITLGSRTALRIAGRQAAYNVAKAGVIVLTQTVAEEVKDQGITANCLVPSVIDTPANRQSMPRSDPTKWVRPEHLAELMVMLATDAGASITGAAIPVYGRV